MDDRTHAIVNAALIVIGAAAAIDTILFHLDTGMAPFDRGCP